jgi:ketosteroid isomerase-like protein
MSEENVARLRAIYDEWGRGNIRAGTEFFAPDIAFEPMAEGRESLSRDEVEPYMRDFLAQWDAFASEAQDFLDLGETVIVSERQRATGKSSGVETEQTFYSVWRFRDGLVVGIRWEADLAVAKQVAGISG